MDKVYKEETLYAAARKVTGRRNTAAGGDHVTPEMFEDRLLENVRELHAELQDETYHPRPGDRTSPTTIVSLQPG